MRSTLLRRLLARSPELAVSSIEEVEALCDTLASDPRVDGLLLQLPPFDAGWAACESLRDALLALRRRNKQVVCYLPEGGGNRELFLALAADRIYALPHSAFGPLGMAAQPLYVRSLLDRLGVAVEVQACGEYKSAAEPALRDTISEPARVQLEALLWARHRALSAALQTRRLDADSAEAFLARGLVSAQPAQEVRAIDGLAYRDELATVLGIERPPRVPEARKRAHAFVGSAAYQRFRSARLWRPVRRPACIAVLALHGTIRGDQGGLPSPAIRPGAVERVMSELRRDRRVAAVVLQIDSPGGSALASELIHREITRVANVKPTIASFGDVAASGGYYIASACHTIVAQPLTITGSIGVVSAKLAVRPLLERAGVHPQVMRTAPHADLLSLSRSLTADEAQLLQAHADDLYQRFLAVVAQGRKRSVQDVEPLARGRVWSGCDALERGLVDALGGLPLAVEKARDALCGLSSAQRAALELCVYRLPSSDADTLGALGVMAEWTAGLSELELLLRSTRHEPNLYFSPSAWAARV